MAPPLPMPVVTTLHTPPMPVARVGGPARPRRQHLRGGQPSTPPLVAAPSSTHVSRPTASTPAGGPPGPGAARPSGRAGSCPRRRRTWRSRPPGRPACRWSWPARSATRYFERPGAPAPRAPTSSYAGHLDQARARRRWSGRSAVALVTPRLGRALRPGRRRGAGVRHAGRRLRAAAAPGGRRRRLRPARRAADDVAGAGAGRQRGRGCSTGARLVDATPSGTARSTGWSTATRSSTHGSSIAGAPRDRLLRPPPRPGHLHRAADRRRTAARRRHRPLVPAPPGGLARPVGRSSPATTSDRVRTTTRRRDSPGPAALGAARTTRDCAQRMAAIAAWIDAGRPAALVVDAVGRGAACSRRLHGIPVVGADRTGTTRRTRAHRSASTLRRRARRRVAAGMDRPRLLPGLDAGSPTACTRWAPSRGSPVARRRRPRRPAPSARRAPGRAPGATASPPRLARPQEQTPDWDWTRARAGRLGTWHAGPRGRAAPRPTWWSSTPGQNALAEVAAARLPAVVVPAAPPLRRAARHRRRAAPRLAGRRRRTTCPRDAAGRDLLCTRPCDLDGERLGALVRRRRRRRGIAAVVVGGRRRARSVAA